MFVAGGDDPCDGDGAEEEEANEGEFLHPSTRDLHHESCSMIKNKFEYFGIIM